MMSPSIYANSIPAWLNENTSEIDECTSSAEYMFENSIVNDIHMDDPTPAIRFAARKIHALSANSLRNEAVIIAVNPAAMNGLCLAFMSAFMPMGVLKSIWEKPYAPTMIPAMSAVIPRPIMYGV